MSLEECRAKLPLPDLWQRLGCSGQFPAASRKAAVPVRDAGGREPAPGCSNVG